MWNTLTSFFSVACLMLSLSFSPLVMRSVPGAIAAGSQGRKRSELARRNPVATTTPRGLPARGPRFAPGTDLSAWAFSAAQDPTPTPAPRLTFSDLKRNDSINGTFIVDGFVIDTYKCPPCPPRAMCKPCLGDHIVVTDNIDERDPALIQRLRIFTDKPEQFELKKKYSFTVKVKGQTPKGRAIENADLISFEAIAEIVNDE